VSQPNYVIDDIRIKYEATDLRGVEYHEGTLEYHVVGLEVSPSTITYSDLEEEGDSVSLSVTKTDIGWYEIDELWPND